MLGLAKKADKNLLSDYTNRLAYDPELEKEYNNHKVKHNQRLDQYKELSNQLDQQYKENMRLRGIYQSLGTEVERRQFRKEHGLE